MDEVAAQRRLEWHEKTRKDKEPQDASEHIFASTIGSAVTTPRVSDNCMDERDNMPTDLPVRKRTRQQLCDSDGQEVRRWTGYVYT